MVRVVILAVMDSLISSYDSVDRRDLHADYDSEYTFNLRLRKNQLVII